MDVENVSPNDAINVAIDTVKIGKQAIVFASSKASCEKTSRDISKILKKQGISVNDEIAKDILAVLSHSTKQCEKLADVAKYGVAFHHAGLAYKQRELLEDAFREGKLKILVATPTLAAGVSIPAFRTILKDLKRFSGWGMSYIPVLEYMQQAGRAGRPEYESFGEAISISQNENQKEEIYEKYVLGVPEEITSKLAVEPVLRTYVLSLVSTGFTKTVDELLQFFSKTFWASQFGDLFALNQKIMSVIDDLKEYEFIEIKSEETHNDFESASNLVSKNKKQKHISATVIGQRVSELYMDPDSAYHIVSSFEKANEKTSAFSYLFMLALTNELKPMSNLTKTTRDLFEAELLKKDESFLTPVIDEYDDYYLEYLNRFRVAFIIEMWITEIGENDILDKYKIRPGELNETISRADWLIYGASELAKLSGRKELVTPLNRLRMRVKYGVNDNLIPLLKLKGVGRVRARKMFDSGFDSIGKIKSASVDKLQSVVGQKVAQNILDQVGEGEKAKSVPQDKGTLLSHFKNLR